jgi:hypothetical protein
MLGATPDGGRMTRRVMHTRAVQTPTVLDGMRERCSAGEEEQNDGERIKEAVRE